MGWIGVDFDDTLSEFQGLYTAGPPIPRMVERVKTWLAEGRDVRIFTARVCGVVDVQQQIEIVSDWCAEHVGTVLPITATKDFSLDEIWDDKARGTPPRSGLSFYTELNA